MNVPLLIFGFALLVMGGMQAASALGLREFRSWYFREIASASTGGRAAQWFFVVLYLVFSTFTICVAIGLF